MSDNPTEIAINTLVALCEGDYDETTKLQAAQALIQARISGVLPQQESSSSVTGPPLYVNRRPHSRSCGAKDHEHGTACHKNCPTCGGMALKLNE